MSQSQEVRVFIRPAIWSALPLFGSGTKMRIRVPAVNPNIGETLRQKEKKSLKNGLKNANNFPLYLCLVFKKIIYTSLKQDKHTA